MDAVRESALRRELDALRERWPDLATWRLVINGRMRSYFGRCYAGRREIHIAAWHVAHGDWADVVDTLRHEAAHALAGKNSGHGSAWRTWARRLGAEPKRCGSQKAWAKSPAAKNGPKWIVTCQECGAGLPRRRRSAGWEQLRHRGCGGRLEWIQIR